MAVPESSLVYQYLHSLTLHIIKPENATSSFCKPKDHPMTRNSFKKTWLHQPSHPPSISKNFLNTLCSISKCKKKCNFISVSQNVKSPQKCKSSPLEVH